MRKKTIYIQGMHCASCEKLLEGELKAVKNIREVKGDWKTGMAEISFLGEEPNFSEIQNIAEKYGYKAFESEAETGASAEKNDWGNWFFAFLSVAMIFFLYRLLQGVGVLNKISFDNSDITFGIAFLVGLVASVSSCLAIVGSVVIAFSEKYESGEKNFFEYAVRSNLLFHVGRLAAFFIFGGLLGFLGGKINISGNFVSAYTIIIAVIMGWLGLNILGVVPSVANFGLKLPKRFRGKWDELKESRHWAAPYFLGALTFFLPCGFTQSMQIFALASGSFWKGSVSLLFFSLGTMPVLLAIGVGASWGKFRKFSALRKIAGIIILLFAVFSLKSGLALKGVKTGVISSNTGEEQPDESSGAPSSQDQGSGLAEQVITMKVTSNGFEPDVFKVKRGIRVKWIIDGVNVSGCTNTIIVPSLDISKSLRYGENIIEFTPQKKGDLDFSCGMGMVRGKIIAE